MQEVASKITPATPTITTTTITTTTTTTTAAKKYDVNEYPQLGSNTTTLPASLIHAATATTTAAAPVNNTEEEFPSLASASKIKKPQTTNMVKGGTAINFAAAAKKKGTAVNNSNKLANAKKAVNKRHGYSIQRLKQPVHIPWLDTGSALNSIYMKEVSYRYICIYVYIYI